MTTKTTRAIFVTVLALGVIGSGVALSQNVTAQSPVGEDIVRYEPPTFDTPEIQRMTEIAQKLGDTTITEAEKTALIAEATQIKESFAANVDTTTRQTMKDKEAMISNFIAERLKTQPFDEFQNEFPITGLYVDDVTNQLVINVDSREFSDTVTANILQQVRGIAGQEMDVVVQPMPSMTP